MKTPPGKPLGLRERKKQETMARLRSATRELMWDKGFEEVTTKEIANHADIGEATLFRYAASKIDLFLLVYGEEFEAVVVRCEERELTSDSGSRDPETYLQRILEHYGRLADLFVRYPELAYTFIKESFGSPTDIGRTGLSHGDRWYGVLRGIVEQAQAMGAFVPVDSTAVVLNCHALYIHEVLRTYGRGFPSTDLPGGLRTRLQVLLRPLFNIPRSDLAAVFNPSP